MFEEFVSGILDPCGGHRKTIFMLTHKVDRLLRRDVECEKLLKMLDELFKESFEEKPVKNWRTWNFPEKKFVEVMGYANEAAKRRGAIEKD